MSAASGSRSAKDERPSETELVEREARPRDGESVAQSLQRSLLHLHNRRGIAYARLNQALRATAKRTNNINQYRIVCANVTEDLKLVSEGVIALRKALWRDYLPGSKQAVKWLDRLQHLEEQKLIAYVSLHTIQRSRDAGLRPPRPEGAEGAGAEEVAESLEAKMSRFAKKLDEIDGDISDLMDEIREYIMETLED